MTLAKYIKEQRLNAALSQKEAVRLLGYKKPQFLSNLERGTSRPPVEVLKRMCEIYRTSYEDMREKYIKESIEIAQKKAEGKWELGETATELM